MVSVRKESDMSLCDSYCEPCIYSRTNDQFGLTTCNYINVVGVSRGCPAGKGCDKRVIGEKKKTIESFIFRGRCGNAEE